MKELKEFTVERLEQYSAITSWELLHSNVNLSDLRALAKIALAAKQVRTGRSQCVKCGGEGMMDSGGTQPWGEPISVECDCATPPLNHTEQHMVVPDGWVAIPKEMLADYRDVKNVEIQTYKASFGSHCDIPRSRWQRDLADLTEELEEIDKLIAAPKPEM